MRKTVEEIIDTIKYLKQFTTDYEVADLLGVGLGALSNAKKRDSISFIDELIIFCERENLTLDFIRTDTLGREKTLKRVSAPARIPREQNEVYVQAPVLSYPGRAPGEQGHEEVGTVILPREVYGEGSIVVQVSGDSMEKLLMDGTSVVVETGEKEIFSGCLYAYLIPWEGSVVRECIAEPTGISLIPYNKNYPASLIRWEEFDPENLIGTVSCSVMNVFR